jgi:hypothetical protein
LPEVKIKLKLFSLFLPVSRKNKERILVLFLSAIILFIYYSRVILYPNDYFIASSSDGIKAYAVYAGHIKNDTSYHHFANMNYPYGQVHVFADGQTLIANLFKLLAATFPFFIDYSIGLFNLMMITSFVWCSLFLCLILQRFRLPSAFIVPGSILIAFLSPQLFRMFGHPTLSYCFFIPMMWWMLLRYYESVKKKIWWSVLIAGVSTASFFVHPYYVMISAMFIGLYYLISEFRYRDGLRQRLPGFLFMTIQVILPLLLSRLYVRMVDHHIMRPSEPWGFYKYHASGDTVFLPHHPPFQGLVQFFAGQLSQEWEGWAYIGLAAVMILFLSIFRTIRFFSRKHFSRLLSPVLEPRLQVALWAAILLLLFSMCLPFKLNMHFLADALPFIKQFRSLGRFAWVFYFVFNVYALYILYLIYRYLRGKQLYAASYTGVVVYALLFAMECHAYHREGKMQSTVMPNYFNLKTLPDEYKELINEVEKVKTDYQCLIPLPFFHIGSEHFEKETTGLSFHASFISSYWNNIPMLASSAARSPIAEAKNIVQFFSPPEFNKKIEQDLPDHRPFLILYTGENLNREELVILQLSQPVKAMEKFELRSLSFNTVFEPDSLVSRLWMTKNVSDTLLFKSFDDQDSPVRYKGNGSKSSNETEYFFLLEKDEFQPQTDTDYEISFWFYNAGESRNQSTCILEQCDANGNNCEWELDFKLKECMTIDGDWSLVRKTFRLKYPEGKICLFIKKPEKKKIQLYADELMICRLN